MNRQRSAAWGLAAIVVAASSCTRAPPVADQTESRPAPASQTASAPAPEVIFTGCRATTVAPLSCEVVEETTVLGLWVAGTRHVPRVHLDGTEVAAVNDTPARSVDGYFVVVEVPRATRRLEVLVGTGNAEARWGVAVVQGAATPVVDELLDALYDPQPWKDAPEPAALIDELRALPTTISDEERIAADSAILALGRGDDTRAYVKLGTELVERALRGGAYTAAVERAHMTAFEAGRAGLFSEAEALLDLASVYETKIADANLHAMGHYHRGAIAVRRRAWERALSELDQAAVAFERLGLDDAEIPAIALQVTPLGLVGRLRELDTLVQRLLDVSERVGRASRCDYAANMDNAAWGLLLAARHGRSLDGAVKLIDGALAILGPDGPCDTAERPEWGGAYLDTIVNGALVHLANGDPETAGQLLGRLSGRQLEPHRRAWVIYIEALIDEASGRAHRATELVAQLRSEAEYQADPLLAWQTSVLGGRLAEAEGSNDAALAAYREAEQRLDALLRDVGIDQGREGLLAGLHTSAARMIRLLLDAGKTRDAADVAMRSRARSFAFVSQGRSETRLRGEDRVAWAREMSTYRKARAELTEALAQQRTAAVADRELAERTAVQLRQRMRTALAAAHQLALDGPPPAPFSLRPAAGELFIVTHPLPQGWVGFAIGPDAARATRSLSKGTPAEVAGEILVAFEAELSGAQRIVVQPMGPFNGVPFHALHVADRQLIEMAPVEYSLGVPQPGGGTGGEPARALVVGNPTSPGWGGLPEAQREAENAAKVLRSGGLQTELLIADGASRQNAVSALETANWFHFAGHGDSAGIAGWDSELMFAGLETFGVREALALRQAPSFVLLSGCKTGYSDEIGAGGMNLASAFVVAGSQRVVAATTEIVEGDARRFFADVYAAAGREGFADVGQLVRLASLEAKARGESTWTQYQVWRP